MAPVQASAATSAPPEGSVTEHLKIPVNAVPVEPTLTPPLALITAAAVVAPVNVVVEE